MNHLLQLDCLEVSCTCNELFCAACKTSAGGLRNLFLLPLVLLPPLVFHSAVPCVSFSPLPLVLLLLPAAVASLSFAPLPG